MADITSRIIALHFRAKAIRNPGHPITPHVCAPGSCSFSVTDPPHLYACDMDPANIHVCGNKCRFLRCDLVEDVATCTLTNYTIVASLTAGTTVIPLNQHPPVPRPPTQTRPVHFDATVHTIANILTHLIHVPISRRSIILDRAENNACPSSVFITYLENRAHARNLARTAFESNLALYRDNIISIANAILRLWAIKYSLTKSPAHRRILFFTTIALTAFRARSFLPTIKCVNHIFDHKRFLLIHAAKYTHSLTKRDKFAAGTITSNTKLFNTFFINCDHDRILHACEPITHLL